MICSLFLLTTPVSASSGKSCPERTLWPGEAWLSSPSDLTAAQREAIAALETYTFPSPANPDDLYGQDRVGVRTDGVVIIRGGALLYERYARGYTADMPHLAWSVTKSFTNALTGIAVQREELSLDDSICKYLDVPLPENCAITPEHLLTFSSGLDWKETYENEPPTASSVVALLYGQGPADALAFIAGHPLRDPPGTTFAYSSGDTTLLAGVVRAALEPEYGREFPWTLLFDPLGARSVTWERDQKGALIGGSYLYATPQDMARFGYLFLNDGCWAGQRLLPEGWVDASTSVSLPFQTHPLDTDLKESQGHQWWLNAAVPEQNLPQPWPDVPPDAYAALGHWKQSITVIPSLDLVVVRTGDDRDGSFDINQFLALAIAVAEAS